MMTLEHLHFFGGGEEGKQRALAYSVLLLFLPGLPFIYQGDELGLESIIVKPRIKLILLALGKRRWL
ncbi:MAG: hypothetical protein Ct9H90mP5_10680 [Acidimicrobiaceae bacterium]|nr:MAG: hypothetical protein Ct9H90mP5_10680 [Acidimicrobiaceae bacterium]